jgi:1-deoxy-D-xylulose-5-phosphate synthase
MPSLRQAGGLSGFTKRSESVFDPFGAAHSSTSISAALGFTIGRDMGQPTGDAIAVIGDGSITAGMAYEALNNAGAEGRRLFVILNDNDMSIAPPVGAMNTYLNRLNHAPCQPARDCGRGSMAALPDSLREQALAARARACGGPPDATMFEHLGFTYIGPIDGHSMPDLLATLRMARDRAEGPVLIHVRTVKGKGYAPAEAADCKYHGVSKFDVASGAQSQGPANAPSYTALSLAAP